MLKPRCLLCRPNLLVLEDAVDVLSIFGKGSEALIVDALSAEATLVSLFLFSKSKSGGVSLFDGALLFFCVSCGGRTGSFCVFMGSGASGCLSLWRCLSLEKSDRFSG